MADRILSPPPTVLVVDDQRVARRLVHRILSEAGYRVFEAQDGVEALDVFSVVCPVDLVLVDVVMPRLDGAALVRELLERRPEQRVLYMSAYPAEVLAHHNAADLQAVFLAKPFTRDSLLEKVEEALRRAPTPVDQRQGP